MLANYNVANLELSQENPSSKLFWLANIWVDNIWFSAHDKKSVTENLTEYFGRKVTNDCRDPN